MDIDCARSGMPFHCIEVALAAADARVDIIQFPVLDLVRPVRICDETVADRNQINQTVRNGLFRNIRVVELPVCHEGEIANHFSYFRGGVEVKADGLVDGANHSPTARVCTASKVDHVHKAGVGKILCNCKALFNRALIVVNAVERHFDCDRIVLSACLANFLDDLSEKALAVFEASAIFICAVVPLRGGELVDQVAAVCMDLDDVNACIFCKLCRFTHCFYETFHALGRQFAADERGHIVVGDGACGVGRRVRIDPVHAANAG